MRAAVRPQSREVSTSSAAITQSGCFLASDDPGKMANRDWRAPRYSRVSRFFCPMWDSNPASSERWIRSGSAGALHCVLEVQAG